MRHVGIGSWLFGGLLALVHAGAYAQQPAWKPDFVQPGIGSAAQTAPLRIHVAGIPADTPQHLAVELDGIDVTSLAALDGSDIVVKLAQPLSFGKHRLRLVEYTPDGGIAERGRWVFEIRESAAFRQAQLQANVTLNATQRVANHNVDVTVGPLQGNGSAQLQGAVANDSWQATGTASIVSSSQTSQMPLQDGHIDIGQYLLSAQSGAVAASVGDHAALGPESLVMQGFARRGVSADLSVGGIAHFSAFSVHATPLAGSRNLTGVQDSQNRIDGMVATVYPVAGNPEELAVSGTYVDGQGTSANGVGVAGYTQAFGGHAGSIVADARLLDKLLRLRGEYASSSYDYDGNGTGLVPQSGHAYSGLASYLPWHSLKVMGQPMVWNIGAQKEVLSTFFQSPANPGAISDRDMGQVFTSMNWYGLNVQAAGAREHDNVDQLPLMPTTDTAQRSFSLNYAPLQLAAPGTAGPPPVPWYGQPNFTVTYMGVKKDLASNPGGLPLPLGPMHETTNLVLAAQFQHATWSWGYTHGRVADQDFDGFTPETRTTSDRLQSAFMVATLNVGANVEHDQVDDLTDATRSQTVTGGATLAYPFTDRVSSSLAYTTSHAWADQPASDQTTSDTTVSLNWVVTPPHDLHPGLSLGLDGNYHSCRDHLADSTSFGSGCLDSYQVFLRMSVSWMPTF